MNRAVIRSFVFIGLIVALGCSTDTPTEPTGTTATATPTPTPAPTPEPTPEPAATGCTLEPRDECGGSESAPGVFGCCDTNVGTDDVYGHQVVAAMQEVLKEPGVLDGAGSIIDEDAFVQAVAAKVEEMFLLCAKQGGPPDELAVKGNNDFSEQFDIVLGSNNTPLFGFFAARCSPARF